MRKAIVDGSGAVLNVIEIVDGATFRLPKGRSLVEAGDNAEPGGTWDGEAFARKVRPVIPDVDGMRGALLDELGIEKANDLARLYPIFDGALLAGRFEAARAVLQLAETRTDLSAEDAATVRGIMASHNIPDA